jgi:hypothetical protein
MKRNHRGRPLVGAIAAAVLTWSTLATERAGAETPYSGYAWGPRFVPAYGGYGYASRYGYADPSPGHSLASSYRSYGIGNGFGTGGTYRGVYSGYVDHAYGASRHYVSPDRPAYDIYGSGGYTPYRNRTQHDYGY